MGVMKEIATSAQVEPFQFYKDEPQYLSLFDISVMLGNNDYWRIAFYDEKMNELEGPENAFMMRIKSDYFLILSIDGQVIETREMSCAV